MKKEQKPKWEDKAREIIEQMNQDMNGWSNVACVEYLEEIIGEADELLQSFGQESMLTQ